MKKLNLLFSLVLILLAWSCAKDDDFSGDSGTFTDDRDGNKYKWVRIGGKIWMAENLRATKYRNGDNIGTTTPPTLSISGETTPKYQWAYDGNKSNVATYGRLYTWYAITDNRNVCPSGWHIPTDDEWITLINFLGGHIIAGGILKEAGITHWKSPNTEATNEKGFTALPGGSRYIDGYFFSIGDYGYWWSSTEGLSTSCGFSHRLDYNNTNVTRYNAYKAEGYSVRCIKDYIIN